MLLKEEGQFESIRDEVQKDLARRLKPRNEKIEVVINSSKLVEMVTLPAGKWVFHVIEDASKAKNPVGLFIPGTARKALIVDMRLPDSVIIYDARMTKDSTRANRNYEPLKEAHFIQLDKRDRSVIRKRFTKHDGTIADFPINSMELLSLSYIAYRKLIEGEHISEETTRQLTWIDRWRRNTSYCIVGTDSRGVSSAILPSLYDVKQDSLRNLFISIRRSKYVSAPLGLSVMPTIK